jgi:glycosyltransferase involved in cell wall biosynthesis
MKILLIHNVHARGGGADVVYLNTGELLKKYGHTVIYFSFKNKKNIGCAQDKYFVNEPSKFGQLANNFFNWEAAKKIDQLIRKEEPDIAHLHSFWGGLTPAIGSVLRKHNIPIVHTVHDYNLICPVTTSIDRNGNICEACKGKSFYKGVVKRCFKGSFIKSFVLSTALYYRRKFFDPLKLIDGFIFVSKFAFEKHLQFMPGLKNSNCLTLHNFNQLTKSTIVTPKRDNYFLFFGRLSREKGIDTLIEAFIGLKGIKLKIVGTGSEETSLRELVRNAGASNIEFLGYKSGDELNRIVSGSSFTMVPSEWWENNPMTIIESYCLGVPVIAANVGGIPEIIDEGETGYLFEMKNVDQLTKTILKANSLTIEEYSRMTVQAYKFATDHFNEQQHLKRLINFYNEILNK